jgi:tetratricopeptide (TPR) repeat protein
MSFLKKLFSQTQPSESNSKRSRLLFQQACDHAQSGKSDESLKCLYEALQLAPNNLDARLLLGMFYTNSNKLGEAANEFNRVLQQDSNNHEALMMLGTIACRQNEPRKGISYLERASRAISDPQIQSVILGGLGAAHYMQHEYQQAIQRWQQSIRFNPKCFEAHFSLGFGYIQLGQLELALHELQIADSLVPDDNTMVYRSTKLMITGVNTLIEQSKSSPKVTPSTGFQNLMSIMVPLAWGLVAQ